MSVVFPVEPDSRWREHTATAGQTVFPVTYPFQDNADITIVKVGLDGTETELSEPANYVLTGAGNPAGGSYTLTAPAFAGEIYRSIGAAVLDRVLSVVRQGRFNSTPIDNDLDRALIRDQELARDVGRAVKVKFGAAAPTMPAEQAGSPIVWNEDGTGLANGPAPAAGQYIAWDDAGEKLINKTAVIPSEEVLPGVAATWLRRNGGNSAFEALTDQEAADILVSLPNVNRWLPTLIGDIDLINPAFGAVRTGAPGTEPANNLAFANAIDEAKNQAALHGQSYGIIKLPSGVFRVNQTIAFDLDCDKITLKGQGSKATTIMTGNNAIDLLSANGGTASIGINDFAFDGIKLAYIGAEVDRTGSADKKAEPSLIRLRNMSNFRLLDVEFEGGYNDLVVNRGAHGNIDNCQSWKRASLYPAGHGIAFTALGDMPGGCTRIFIDHFDLQNRGALPGGCEHGILVETADGLWIGKSHIIQCVNNLTLSPVGDTNRSTVGGVFLSDFYSDTCTQYGIRMQGTAGSYGRIVMDSGYVRDAGVDGVSIAPNAGTTIDTVMFDQGVNIHANERLGINCVTDGIVDLEVLAHFKGNNAGNTAAGGDILVRGSRYRIGGQYTGGGAAGVAIRLASNAGVGEVRGYDVSGSTAGTKISRDPASGAKLENGTYTPTLTNAENVAASSSYSCQWSYNGETVEVSGAVDVDPTNASALTRLGISLPPGLASNFTSTSHCAGVAFCALVAGQGAAIRADVTNDRAELAFTTGADVASRTFHFTFKYRLA